MRAREFINESLQDVKSFWSSLGIDFSIYEHNGVINLSQIVVPKSERKQGIGTKAMQSLVRYADETNQKITLSPSKDFGGSKLRLIQFYKRFGFVPNKGRYKDFTTMETMIRYPKSTVDEYKVDNKNGLGAVPYNQDVDYFGLKVMMKPSTFLELALPLDKPVSVDHIAKHIKNGGSLGAPFLDVSIPPEWEEGDISSPAKVTGHEGRNRMLAIQQVEGDDPVEVHIFPKGGMRARDLTPEIVNGLRNGMMNQEKTRFIRGDLFK